MEDEIDDLKIIDFNNVVTVFAIIMNQYINLVKDYEFEKDFYLSLELSNYALSIPYFDSKKFIFGINDKIIPVNLKPKIHNPYGARYNELTSKEFNFEKFLVKLLQTFGISEFLIEDLLKGIVEYFKEIKSEK